MRFFNSPMKFIIWSKTKDTFSFFVHSRIWVQRRVEKTKILQVIRVAIHHRRIRRAVWKVHHKCLVIWNDQTDRWIKLKHKHKRNKCKSSRQPTVDEQLMYRLCHVPTRSKFQVAHKRARPICKQNAHRQPIRSIVASHWPAQMPLSSANRFASACQMVHTVCQNQARIYLSSSIGECWWPRGVDWFCFSLTPHFIY